MNTALQDLADDRVAEAFPLQHDLLGLADTPSAVALRERRSKGGRPPGARNKRIEDVARAVVEHLGDPLVHLVAIATADVAELVAQGLTVQEALTEKRLAAIGALPYVHQKRPIAVDVSTHQVVHLSITDGVPMTSQNPGVIEAIAVELDSVELDDARNALTSHANPPPAQLIVDQASSAPSADRAPPAPEPPPTPPGGAVSPPAPRPRAHAGVVPPPPRIFSRANQGPRPHGPGGRP